MDIARGVPSPSTLSAFVEQQQNQDQSQSAASETTTSGRSTPATSSSDASKADPPFDFQKFLDQMKSRNAEIVAKYLKSCVAVLSVSILPLNFLISFLSNFAKRTFTVSDQVKIINDFLNVSGTSFPSSSNVLYFSLSSNPCESRKSGRMLPTPSSITRWRAWRNLS